jgi:hypothetical protein
MMGVLSIDCCLVFHFVIFSFRNNISRSALWSLYYILMISELSLVSFIEELPNIFLCEGNWPIPRTVTSINTAIINSKIRSHPIKLEVLLEIYSALGFKPPRIKH